MKPALALIERFKWPLAIVLGLAFIAYIVVVGFGETLGVDPGVRATVENGLRWAWQSAVTLLVPLALRDSDGDGKPDIIDDSVNPPPPLAPILEPGQ